MVHMSKKPAKLIKKAMKKEIKHVRKSSKRLSKRLFDKKGLFMSHRYDNTVSFFFGGNESKPLYTVNTSGSYKVPVLKIIIGTLCVISGAVLFALAVKAIVKRTAPEYSDDYDELEYIGDDEDLPF